MMLNTPTVERRFNVLAGVAVTLFIVLIARLWFLQVLSNPVLQEVAAGNRTREVISESPRGRIFDVEGRVLAGRRESLVVTLDWQGLRHLEEDERSEIFLEVAMRLNEAGNKTKAARLERVFDRAASRSLQPVIVAEDVGEELWVILQERPRPGFNAERRTLRTYPYGTVAAHLLGYVGTVQDTEQAAELNSVEETKPYQPGDELGQSGIEKIFDHTLRGTPQRTLVEINAKNEVVRTIEVLQEGAPGDDIHLTIDVDLQAAAEDIVQEELELARVREACDGCPAHAANAGSMVALDVTDGSVVALASYPAFDPEEFLFGLTQAQADYLFQNEDRPFLNRAIAGLYPAGSTFKPIPAYTAVVSGLRQADEIWDDEGSYRLETCENPDARCVFRNAQSAVLGEVDLTRALAQSSDTYFYSLGERFWTRRSTYGDTAVQDTANLFGLGVPTGVQLPGERAGYIPTPESRKERHEENPAAFPTKDWFAGDNVNMIIGQGDVLITPLQLANTYSMLALNGIRHQPRLVARVSHGTSGRMIQELQPRIVEDHELDAEAMNSIQRGLLEATSTGTAANAFLGFPHWSYPIAGKTGTSQVANKADFSLFAAYGPATKPKYSVAVVLEQAGFGGQAAAPAARKFFDYVAGNVPLPQAQIVHLSSGVQQ